MGTQVETGDYTVISKGIGKSSVEGGMLKDIFVQIA